MLIVDDQPLIRSGLRMVLGSQPDIEVVGEAVDGADAVRQVTHASTAPDVVVMDVRMPGMDGVEATRRLLALPTAPRVLVLTTFDVDEHAHSALRAGASGFLLKDTPPERLVEAVRTVFSGDAVIAPSTTRRLLDTLVPAREAPERTAARAAAQARVASLTPREREVLQLVADGRSNPEIAAQLFVTEATVKTHISALLSKLSARDRVHAVITAYDAGLVGPS